MTGVTSFGGAPEASGTVCTASCGEGGIATAVAPATDRPGSLATTASGRMAAFAMLAKGCAGKACACGVAAAFSGFVIFVVRAAVAVAGTIRLTGADTSVPGSGRPKTTLWGSVVLPARGRTDVASCDSGMCGCHADGVAGARAVATVCAVATRRGARIDSTCEVVVSPVRFVISVACRVAIVADFACAD